MPAERIVYIDESCHKWFGLKSRESNLAYGVLSLPWAKHSAMKKFYKRIDAEIRGFYLEDVGTDFVESEVKATTVGKLSVEHRETIAKAFENFFKKNYGKLFGYYVNAEGFIKNAIRNEHYDIDSAAFEAIKLREGAVYEEWLKRTLEEREAGVGESELLKDALQGLISCIFHFHIGMRQTFEIVYDSRNAEEDAVMIDVAEAIGEMVRASEERFRNQAGVFYRGMRTATSEDEIGLRLADFVAGGTRMLFRQIPELLSDDTGFDILTAKMNERMLKHADYGTIPFYEGKVSEVIASKAKEKGQGIMFPHWWGHYAKKMLTYITKEGAARHWLMEPNIYTDMAD